jgi:hypothetical protein
LARIKVLQSPLHATAAFLSSGETSRYYQKRSSSVMKSPQHLPVIDHVLKMQGTSVSPGRGKPSPRTINMERMLAGIRCKRLYM